jgi:hypothetical protein
VKILFRTDRVSTVSKDMGQGKAASGVAWFELVLHEGPPNEKTWEGGGQTIAYWREQFARLRNPHPWTVEAHSMEGVQPAVIPDDALQGLPEDARISFHWNFVTAEVAAKTWPPSP